MRKKLKNISTYVATAIADDYAITIFVLTSKCHCSDIIQ